MGDDTKLARPRVPYLDGILGQKIPVLDHGFIRVIDYMGDQSAIVQAARVSYGNGTKTVSGDRGLIRYLMRHWHTSPFEMCEIKLHVKLPIFVARQWIRHRTANVNEVSARYSILPGDTYNPGVDAIAPQSAANKQGRAGTYDPDMAFGISGTVRDHNRQSVSLYETLSSDEINLARELARVVLPVSTYTEWYWKIDLHNLLHFLRLRADPHAQLEIREYAETISQIVGQWLPDVWDAFVDYRLESFTFSKPELDWLREVFDRNVPDSEFCGLGRGSAREIAALKSILGFQP